MPKGAIGAVAEVPAHLVTRAELTLKPRGPRYEARRWLGRPARALVGGERAMVATFEVSRAGEVTLRVHAHAGATDEEVERAVHAARGLAGVDDDPTRAADVVQQHPLVRELFEKYDARITRTPTVFEAFTVAVLEQLVTGIEARASHVRLVRIAGAPVDGSRLVAAPTADAVRQVPMWRLREIGVGAKRAATLREGAHRGAALERLRDVAAEVALERIQSLPGVGPWTANYVARLALDHADAVPVGDVHAPYLVTQVLTGEEGDDAAMLEALEPFRPHRARVVSLIERALYARTLPGARPPRKPRVDAHRRYPWQR